MKKNNYMNYTQYFLNYWPEQKQNQIAVDIKIKNGLKNQLSMSRNVPKQFALNSGC
jgi:hypothetical protein